MTSAATGGRKRAVLKALGVFALSVALTACGGRFETSFPEVLDPDVTRTWRVTSIDVRVPNTLSVSDANRIAPIADIVWHGDPEGDRRAQVGAIVSEGLRRGASSLRGPRSVVIAAQVTRFHGVTPAAVNQAPAAVHDIEYTLWVSDRRTGEVLAGPVPVIADLPAYTQSAAVVAASEGRTEKSRIISHLAAVTRGWLGIDRDPRRTFTSLGL